MTTKKRAPRERWRLSRTLEETTPIDYDQSTTPFFDCRQKLYARLTDELLYFSAHELKTGVKLRAVDQTIVEDDRRIARVRLFIYLRD